MRKKEQEQGISVCQKKERERLVRRVKSWFKRSRQSGRVHFETLREGLSLPGTLEALAAKPEQCWTLSEFVKKRLHSTSRLPFLKFLLAKRERVSRQELAKVWNVCLEGWDDFLKALQRPVFVDVPDGGYVVCQEDDAYLWTKNGQHGKNSAELLQKSLVMDPLFVDYPRCCYRYCRHQKPGWEMLRYVVGRRHSSPRMPKPMETALREDDWAAFAICLDTSGMRLTYSLLWEVLSSSATGVFRFLLENDKILNEVIPLSELCCLLVANFPDAKAVPMLEIIEEVKPGTVGAVRDAFGRNLLWYTVHNRKTVWFADDFGIAHFLMTHGCTPQNTNQAGITWKELCETLNDDQKKHFYELRNRYGETFSQSDWPAWWKAKYPRSGK